MFPCLILEPRPTGCFYRLLLYFTLLLHEDFRPECRLIKKVQMQGGEEARSEAY